MGYFEILLLAIGLSMDAFAVSICKGLAMERVTSGKAAIVGLWFGGFQGGMPILGWLLGSRFAGYLLAVSRYVAFALLLILGINMLREAKNQDADEQTASLGVRVMLAMAVATSIDALAVGVTFAFLEVEVWTAALIIAVVTFLISALGVKVGNVFGSHIRKKAEALGGIILILIGLKLLVFA